MSKNLIIIILIIILEAVFAVLNINNKTDISIGFKVFKDIPVFITIIIAFMTGALIFSPLAFLAGKNYAKSAERKKELKNQKKMLKELKDIKGNENKNKTEE